MVTQPSPAFFGQHGRGFAYLIALCLMGGAIGVAPGQAAEVTRAEITKILDSPQVYIQEHPAKLKDIARSGERVRTAQARAQLTFNTGAIARLTANSSLTVNTQCAQLRQGIILVSGAVNVCTQTIVTGVRGTTYTIEADDQKQITVIKVYEGKVMVSPLPAATDDRKALFRSTNFLLRSQPLMAQNPSAPKQVAAFTLNEGEEAIIDLSQGKVTQQNMSWSKEYQEELLEGPFLKGYTEPLPTRQNLYDAIQRLFPGMTLSPENQQALGPVKVPIVQRYCQQLLSLYKTNLQLAVKEGWKPPQPPSSGRWITLLEYRISRDLKISNMAVVKSSGYPALDQSAIQRVFALEGQLRPLPSCLPGSSLFINHRFELNFQSGLSPL
ncbi:hypothetical protein BST81_07555 [Leptolyngbya sp. 'hensonii']|uniref:FecR domain-containing protein n=1 Tax=Leptolyngbya sp. 'hensonii' TaxID=1922337 RepID=UPI0009501427|nr:FecR domain-containing protein [Leptolyngbya sp. 'hensonii']OLP19062.1 hypothetical protein BST81_07555 [Leptolyngbya sp. 'hensonii']